MTRPRSPGESPRTLLVGTHAEIGYEVLKGGIQVVVGRFGLDVAFNSERRAGLHGARNREMMCPSALLWILSL